MHTPPRVIEMMNHLDEGNGRTMEQVRADFLDVQPLAENDVAVRLARIEAKLNATDQAKLIAEQLSRIESHLCALVQQRTIKDWYTTREVAILMDKKEYTVREWCRLRRIHCKKLGGGRGNEGEWRISHEELLRIQTEGLLPIPLKY